jgi:hypothetical protein
LELWLLRVQDSPFGLWVAESVWGYPVVLSIHAVGMALVVGAVVMIDLRILGFASSAPLAAFARLSTVGWIGLTLNALSGLTLFTGDPVRFFHHPVFWTKLSLVALGALTLWVLGHTAAAWSEAAAGTETSPRIRSLAALSLLFWSCAIVAGRSIAYFELG